MNTLTVNGVNLTTAFGVVPTLTDTFEAAEPDIEYISVPGRSGDLVMSNDRFSNIEVTFPAFIYRNMKTNVKGLSAFLNSLKGYVRIEDSVHTEEFRLGQYAGGFKPSIGGQYEAASFDISFNCKPQRYLKSGETAQTFTASGSITNPTRYASKPLLTVVGSGSVIVGGVTITIDTEQTDITIDCETGDCYHGSTNCNGDVSFSSHDLPTIPAGASTIGLDGVTSVSIVPRWFSI